MPDCFGEYGSMTECTANGKIGCSVKESCKRKYKAVINGFKELWMPIQKLREQRIEQRRIWKRKK